MIYLMLAFLIAAIMTYFALVHTPKKVRITIISLLVILLVGVLILAAFAIHMFGLA